MTLRRMLVVLPIAALCLLLSWPQALGAQRLPVVAQLIAFRAPLAAMLGIAGLALVVIAVARRSVLAAALALLLGAGAAANAGVVLSRGVQAETTHGELVVASWNTLGGAVDAETIARLALDERADALVLPETSAAVAEAAARIVSAAGRPMAAGTALEPAVSTADPTSVLIAASLGEYRQDVAAGTTPAIASGVWRPVDGEGPVIVAAHPSPPMPWSMPFWSAGLDWVAEQCADAQAVVAGDLNATVDHFGTGLGGCRGAASAAGTWPTGAPAALGAPIDHVLAGAAWKVESLRVIEGLDDAGSDHRPVVAELSRR